MNTDTIMRIVDGWKGRLLKRCGPRLYMQARYIICVLIASLCYETSSAVAANPTIWVDPVAGAYGEQTVDLIVKVLGDQGVVSRTYTGQAWDMGYLSAPWRVAVATSHLSSSEPGQSVPVTIEAAGVVHSGNAFMDAAGSVTSGVFYSEAGDRLERTPDGWTQWLNNGQNLRFSASGQVVALADSLGRAIQFGYDAQSNRIEAVRDHFSNQVFWIEYAQVDGIQRVVKVQDAIGRSVSYAYSSTGNLTNVVDVAGYVTSYAYDTQNRLIKMTRPDGYFYDITYNPEGLVSRINQTTYQYAYEEGSDTHYCSMRGADGVLVERWFNGSGTLIRRSVNGQVVQDASSDEAVAAWPRISRDEVGAITRVEFEDGRVRTYAYDGVGSRLSRAVDEHGVVTAYYYDRLGQVTSEVFAAGTEFGRTNWFAYDAVGNMTGMVFLGDGIRDELAWSWNYDPAGNPTVETDPWGNVTSNAFDIMGAPLRMTKPGGFFWEYWYDARGLMVGRRDPLGYVTSNRYDEVGRTVWSRDSSGKETTWTYPDGGLLAMVSNSCGESVSWEYDAAGRVVQFWDEDGVLTQYAYDEFGGLIPPSTAYAMARDAFGRVTNLTVASGVEWTYQYDNAHDRLTSVAGPRWRMDLIYDDRGRLSKTEEIADGEIRTNQYIYDEFLQVVEHVDPEGAVTKYGYDLLGQLVQVVDPLGYTNQVVFGADGEVLRITDAAGKTIVFDYDDLTRTVSYQKPDGQSVVSRFDVDGRIQEWADSGGRRRQYDYDPLGQVTGIVHSVTNGSLPAQVISLGYDGYGRIGRYSDGRIDGTYSYDDCERTMQITIDNGQFSKTLEYEYDRAGRPIALTTPEGERRGFEYTPEGILTSIEISGLGLISFSQDPETGSWDMVLPGGGRQSVKLNGFGDVVTNGLLDAAGNPIRTWRIQHDRGGRITSVQGVRDRRDYSYDAAGRLVQVSWSPGDVSEVFDYDAVGNRVSSNNDEQWVYENWNRLVSWPEGQYRYDFSGAVTQRVVNGTTNRLEYDVAGRLAAIRDGTGTLLARYVYDAMGRRICKEMPAATNWYLYSNEGLLGEYDAQGALLRADVFRPNAFWMADPVCSRQDGAWSFYVNNFIGAADCLVSVSGATVWQAAADAFGRMVVSEGENTSNPWRFSGQYFDEESGLHYNTFRYYDPVTGRYLTQDPFEFEGGTNLYLFCAADPINRADWNGAGWLGRLLNKGGNLTLGGWCPPGRFPSLDPKNCTAKILCKEFDEALVAAKWADAIYNGKSTPEGYDQVELVDSWSGMQGGLFRDPKTGHCWLTYRGTENDRGVAQATADWGLGNLLQGVLGPASPQYAQAVSLARRAKKLCGDNLSITGHSLGGGLAQAAAQATCAKTYTFNAAGLSGLTARWAGTRKESDEHIYSYFVKGEVLSSVQDHNPLRVVGVGPKAIGWRIGMQPANPDKDAVSKHAMEEVVATINKEKARYGCSQLK